MTDGRRSISRSNQHHQRRRKQQLALERLESRQLLAVTPVQMSSGAEDSSPVRFATTKETFDITTIVKPTSVLSRDIHGDPIDFDKDGQDDVVFSAAQVDEVIGYVVGDGGETLVSCSRSNQIEVGFGSGRFSSQGISIQDNPGGSGLCGLPTVSESGTNVAVLDINGDGYQDLFVTESEFTRFRIFNPDTGLFLPSVNLSHEDRGNSNPGKISLADFNDDGAPDLVWTVYTTVSVDELNTVSIASGFRIYSGILESDGSWNGLFDETSPVEFSVGEIPITRYIEKSANLGFPDVTGVARDFDNDGDLDLAFPTNTGIRIYSNPGNGDFDPGQFVAIDNPSGVPGLFLTEGDFNDDGLLDLVSSPNSNASETFFADNEVRVGAPLGVYINTSTPGSISMQPDSYDGLRGVLGFNGPITVADMNLDGYPDLVMTPAAQESTIYAIGLGDGAGSFETPTAFVGYANNADPLRPSFRRTIVGLGTGDFDGDGMQDVVSLGTQTNINDNIAPQMSLFGVSYNSTFVLPSPTSELPDGEEQVPYSGKLAGKGGDLNLGYSFALSPLSAPLPPGLTLAPDGTVSGTPQRSGNFTLLVDVSQSNGLKGRGFVTLNLDSKSDTSQPSVDEISQVSPNPRDFPLESIVVTFSEMIEGPSFTTADLSLTRDGQPVALQNLSFNTSDNTVFTVGGLASFTSVPGLYSLTVDATGVRDTSGNSGNNSESVNFTMSQPPASSDLVRIRLQATNQSGQPISTISHPSTFLLEGHVTDLREDQRGVFSAYLDVLYDSTLVDIGDQIEFGAEFFNGQSSSTAVAGLINEVGAFADLRELGAGEFLLFRTTVTTRRLGQVDFVPNRAEEMDHEILLFGVSQAIAPENVEFLGTSVNVALPAWQNPINRLDVDASGFVSALDALVIINEASDRHYSDPQTNKLPVPTPPDAPPPYFDTNGDGFLTVADALAVINGLNAGSVAEGEGEFLGTALYSPLPAADCIWDSTDDWLPPSMNSPVETEKSSRSVLSAETQVLLPAVAADMTSPTKSVDQERECSAVEQRPFEDGLLANLDGTAQDKWSANPNDHDHLF